MKNADFIKELQKKDLSTSGLDLKSFKELREYRKIGTVEECREAREKQRAKKSTNKRYEEEDFEYVGGCPCCGNIVGEEWTYCFKCGQKLDWSKP